MTSLLKMTGSFSIQSQRVSLPCTAHSHEFLEVANVEKGWATHTLNGVSRRLNTGDVVLVNIGEVHSYDSGSSDLTVVNCLFQPGLLDTSLIHCRSFPVLLNSCMPGMGEGCAAFGGKGKIFHDREGEILEEEYVPEGLRLRASIPPELLSLIAPYRTDSQAEEGIETEPEE